MGRRLVTTKKRVFVSFAVPEDTYARDFPRGQARDKRSPIDFIDMSVKQPWSNTWKTQCRRKIKGCDGVVALLSKATPGAKGARWEMKCAIDEGIPIYWGAHLQGQQGEGAVGVVGQEGDKLDLERNIQLHRFPLR